MLQPSPAASRELGFLARGEGDRYAYEDSMGIVVADLFEKFSSTASDGPFQVACSVEDFELLCLPLVDRLRPNGDVSYVCLWPEYQVLSNNPLIDIAPINRSYEDPLPADELHLVIVASAVGSLAQIEAMLLHLMSDSEGRKYNRLSIVSPVVHRKALYQIREMLPAEYQGKVEWSYFKVERNLHVDGSPNPGLGMSGAGRVGLDDLAARRRFIPKTIRAKLYRDRDLGPDPADRPLVR